MSLQSEYDIWHRRIYDANPGHEDASSPWYQLVREYLGSVAGLRILEVACGRGGFVRELARAGARVTGCDFSASALRVAGTKLGAADAPLAAALIQADAQNLPFADSTFDLVISCETIEHLPDVQSAIRGMYRVTRPGGKLFLTTPNYANFMGLYEVYSRVRHPSRKDDQPFDRRQWFPQILGWVRRAGWTVLGTDGTVHQFPFLPGRNPIRWEALESNRAVRKLLSPLAYTYFVMAQKNGQAA
ncbi:MAG TPA: methyltransferase domain-containing protein [Candidatus Acidoferrum sp.]|nr:methyltransferase domain-containing protein [Candidatus Acidoferrum sp.]